MTSAPELYPLPGFHEPFSALSHLLGAGLFLVMGARLIRRGRGDRGRVAFLAVYAASCVVLLAVSGVYHMLAKGGAGSRVLVRLDHAAIFGMIAGTFTPVHGILFRGWMRWAPLAVVWAAAGGGIVLSTAFIDRVPEWVGLTLYLSLSWLGAGTSILLWRRFGFRFIRPLVAGGVAYSAGAVAEFLRWPTVVGGVVEAHEVFHVAVLVGALLHYVFVWQFADGPSADIPRPSWPKFGGIG